ncbi:MAG TPA: SDR family oxidoreductase [Jatrophihabitans sp.]|nr:SDR family oxidoreductase [Jatrophihabitans sp.]
MGLQDRVILITGAGSGLGRATARRLAAGGAHVIVTDLDGDAAAETAAIISGSGLPAGAYALDVSDPAQAAELIGRLSAEFGERFDGLVNNAGTDRGANLLELTDENWQSVIGVNQSGPMYLTREFVRTLTGRPAQRPPADVVNVISISAITVGTGAAAYNSSKAALAMLTKIMQREALEFGWPVRVHGLMPSAMNTPMMQQWQLADEVMMDPDTVASAIQFMLCLPPDSFVQNLVINSRREPGWPR